MFAPASFVRADGLERINRARYGGEGGRLRHRAGIAAVLGMGLTGALFGLAGPQIVSATSPPPPTLVWSVVSNPGIPSGSVLATLNDVTCVGASDCWAVGASQLPPPRNNSATLTEQNTGAGWSIVPSPNPTGPPNSTALTHLSGVTCVSASDCWAVGAYTNSEGSNLSLIEQYDGTSWSVVSSPNPTGNTIAALNSVACEGADDCWAVGYYKDSLGNGDTLVEQNTGTGWNIVSSPDAGSTWSELYSVTCVSTSDCWAAGVGDGFTLTEQDTGSGWVVVSSPNPSGSTNSLFSGVTCVAANDCWAVGDYTDSSGDEHPLTEKDTGSGWSIVSSPTASGSGSSTDLTGVFCVTADECWAVGYYGSGTGSQTLIEEDTGSGWSIFGSPSPPGGSALNAVTCLSASDCISVGFSTTSGGASEPLIEQTYPSTASAYTPLLPFRVCDTRPGTDTECSSDGALGQGQTMTFQVTGVDGPSDQSVPADAQSVVLNVTAISGSSYTYLTVFPAGSAVPTASNLNVGAVSNQANLAVVALGTDGQVSIYNSLGNINVAVDVQGYFAAPSGSSSVPGLFHPIPPLRLCDTRKGVGTACSGTSADNLLNQNQWTRVVVSGCPTGDPSCTASVPTNGTAAAVALNLTAVNGSASTYLSVVPPNGSDVCPSGAPSFSNLNVGASDNLPNRVIVPLGPEQDVCVYNSLGSINFILDVNGWFGTGAESSQGAYFFAMIPTRICDTRSAASVGYSTECSGETLSAGGILTVPVAGVDGVPSSATTPPVAIIANVTAVAGSSYTYFTLYPSDVTRPLASDLNVNASQNCPNLVIVQLSSTGSVDLYNSLGSINAILDVAGWFQT